jgi:hypothetical protein
MRQELLIFVTASKLSFSRIKLIGMQTGPSCLFASTNSFIVSQRLILEETAGDAIRFSSVDDVMSLAVV